MGLQLPSFLISQDHLHLPRLRMGTGLELTNLDICNYNYQPLRPRQVTSHKHLVLPHQSRVPFELRIVPFPEKSVSPNFETFKRRFSFRLPIFLSGPETCHKPALSIPKLLYLGSFLNYFHLGNGQFYLRKYRWGRTEVRADAVVKICSQNVNVIGNRQPEKLCSKYFNASSMRM